LYFWHRQKAAKKAAAAGEELVVEEDIDRDFYSIAGLLIRMEIRDEGDADTFE
jgi:hypothetical protein